jgi:rhodanese-related sulfurtransferase
VKPLLAAGKLVMIDARAASAYQAEHIPGAMSLPAGSPTAEVSAFVAKHGKNTPYVIYCGSGQCGLSKMAADALISQGCSNVKVMPGGFSEYRVSEAKSATVP